MTAIISHLQQLLNINLFSYLDDILIFHTDKDYLQQQTTQVIQQLNYLGFKIQPTKCQLQPTQHIQYLGHIFDTRNPKLLSISINSGYLHKIRKAFLQANTVSPKQIQRLQGLLSAALQGHFFARQQLSWMRHFSNLKAINYNKYKQQLLQVFKHTAAIFAHQAPIKHFFEHSTPFVRAWTDASNQAIGLHLQFQNGTTTSHTRHFANHEQHLHINVKETMGAIALLQLLVQQLPPASKAHIFSDSITTLSNIKRHFVAASPQLQLQLQRSLRTLYQRDIRLEFQFVQSEDNLADLPSRSRSFNDFSLNPRHLSQALFQLHLHRRQISMDLFASTHNAQVPSFISLIPEPLATYTNAMTIPWTPDFIGHLPYANPPFNLMSRVINKFRLEAQHPLLLVAPVWTARPWWNQLLQLATQVVHLPTARDLYLPPPVHHHLHHQLRPPNWQSILAYLEPLDHKQQHLNSSHTHFKHSTRKH